MPEQHNRNRNPAQREVEHHQGVNLLQRPTQRGPVLPRGGLARAAAGLNPQLNLRLINAINTDALAESMAQSRGLEQTILNVIDRNGSFLRQRIGG